MYCKSCKKLTPIIRGKHQEFCSISCSNKDRENALKRAKSANKTKKELKKFIPKRSLFLERDKLIDIIEQLFFANGYLNRNHSDGSNASIKLNTKKLQSLKAEILFYTDFCQITAKMSERLFCLFSKLENIPLCEECNSKYVNFVGMNGIFYRRFCSTKCAAISNLTKFRRSETNVEVYGFPNVGQSQAVKDKIIETNLGRHGVENTFALTSCYSKISSDLFNTLLQEFSGNKTIKFGSYNSEFRVDIGSKYYKLDFYIEINGIKKCIEFFGDYWHHNPLTSYVENVSCEIWEKDFKRINEINSQNIKVYIVWELDYNRNKEQVVIDCIKFLRRE